MAKICLFRTSHIFWGELITEEWYSNEPQLFLNKTLPVLNSESFFLLDELSYKS